jgi:hypothetical protein
VKTKILYIALAVLALAVGAASPGLARQSGGGDIMQKAINKPSANWSVYGTGQKTTPIKDKTVQGGGAVKVEVQAASDKPWSVGAAQPISGKVTKGDMLMVAFWAKAESVDGGPATADISAVRVQQSAEPYDAAIQGGVKVGDAWKMYTVRGRAAIDIPEGGGSVGLHLASAKQTVLLGALFVLDFGPDGDANKPAS